MKFGVNTKRMTLRKRESLDDSAINVTVDKRLSRRRSLSTGDINSLSPNIKHAIKHGDITKELPEAQTPQDGKNPSLEDFAKYFTQSFLLQGQQKVLLEELAKWNKELETLSWSSKENIDLLKRHLQEQRKEKEAQSKEIKEVEVQVMCLRQNMTRLTKKNESDNRQILALERELQAAQDEVEMLRSSNVANKNAFVKFKVQNLTFFR